MIHMVLQGKGGVGKSFVAALITQFLQDRGQRPVCIDTDPVNATFAGYSAFGVQTVDLLAGGRDIDPRRFDQVVEIVAAADREQHVVIDNGASTFLPLADYMLSYDVPGIIKELGHELTLHSVVTGGQAQDDTLQGLLELLKNFALPVVVWLNPFCGRIEKDGQCFTDLKLYHRYKDRIVGVVEIPEFAPRTIGLDLSELLKAKRPFREAVGDAKLQLMTRQRLRMAQRDLYNRVELAGVL